MKIEFTLDLNDYSIRNLINSPFYNLYREKGDQLMMHNTHQVSSWFKDHPSKGGIKCFAYEHIGSGLELVIVSDESPLDQEKMLDHIIENNGFPLSKDNLFLLTEVSLFKEYLLSETTRYGGTFDLIAPAHNKNLIEQQYLYYPCLKFEKQKHIMERKEIEKFHNLVYLNYTYIRVDHSYNPNYFRFAYFRPKIK